MSQITINGEYGSLRLKDDSVEVNLTDRSETKVFGKTLGSRNEQLIVNACRIESTAVPADDEGFPCETC